MSGETKLEWRPHVRGATVWHAVEGDWSVCRRYHVSVLAKGVTATCSEIVGVVRSSRHTVCQVCLDRKGGERSDRCD
jgi:hypothetical protein